jgi:all-trans-retinol 13,14-reductase
MLMPRKEMDRREFIASVAGGFSLLALDWSAFPRGAEGRAEAGAFDAIVIGSGLGGLSCAAAFARQGFKVLVLEQHVVPGGYATTFKRPGGFVFDVSLHSTSVPDRDGVHNLIPGFPEITDVEFVPHHNLYRAVFPEHDIRVPQKNLKGYVAMLTELFPGESDGIEGLFQDMKGVSDNVSALVSAKGQVDMSRFPVDFPYLFKSSMMTWGQMVDARLTDPKLKAIVSALWGYYGLPPSRLASYYYAMPTFGYLTQGGYYPRGRSQRISDAFVTFIEDRGGKVALRTRVEKILVKDGAAYGVRTAGGDEYTARVVVSNANAHDTFGRMIDDGDYLREYLDKLSKYSVSMSTFQVFLGLKEDLVGKVGIADSEIFVDTGYDPEAAYRASLAADVENGSYSITLYDNVYEGYSPEGKNTLNIITLQGYGPWEKYERDYFDGEKAEYRREKERMADVLIRRAEEGMLPGLSDAIEVREVGTPLTNVRYTSNYRGAAYGWDQTLDNSGATRVPHETPVKNLYLSGAWTRPGHGYGGVLYSGLECFSEIMKSW